MNQRIREVRRSAGLTQSEFAQRLGISASAVNKIEMGINSPSEQTLRLICSGFGVNLDWLTTGRGEMLRSDDALADVIRVMSGDDPVKQQLMQMIANMPTAVLLPFAQWLRDNSGPLADALDAAHGKK